MHSLRNIVMQQVQQGHYRRYIFNARLQHITHGSNNSKHKYGQHRNCQIREMATNTTRLVDFCESRRFMIDCFKAVKVPESHAEQMADLLVNADYRKHYSHGMNRLELYINDLINCNTSGEAEPTIIKETSATAWVDGQNGLGAVVGNFCMNLAIKKAKSNSGIGWVCARRSNHYGMAGWYAMTAMKEGLIGMSMTNTSPLMVPTRGKQSVLGTNPLSLAVPMKSDKFILDMATTAVAVGKIEIQRRKGEPLPKGWAQDREGKMTTSPEDAFSAGCLLPVGGIEETSGYKGYGLGALVDILCGVLSGANYSTKIRKWTDAVSNSEADLGQLFIAIDPSCFSPCFSKDMLDFNCRLRSSTPIDPRNRVIIPGDKEEQAMKDTDAAGGIEYIENQIETCIKLAKKLKIKPLKYI